MNDRTNDHTKLMKLIALAGSDNDAEAIASFRKATHVLAGNGISWTGTSIPDHLKELLALAASEEWQELDRYSHQLQRRDEEAGRQERWQAIARSDAWISGAAILSPSAAASAGYGRTISMTVTKVPLRSRATRSEWERFLRTSVQPIRRADHRHT
jgi:hypothetical protein